MKRRMLSRGSLDMLGNFTQYAISIANEDRAMFNMAQAPPQWGRYRAKQDDTLQRGLTVADAEKARNSLDSRFMHRLRVSENIFKNPHNVYFLVKQNFIFKSTSFKNRIFSGLYLIFKRKVSITVFPLMVFNLRT